MQIHTAEIRRYLESRLDAPVEIQEIRQLGKEEIRGAEGIKQFGFGRPLMVTYQSGEQISQIVLHRINQNAFGRERESDRVAAVWLDYKTFNLLPRHVRAIDMLYHTNGGQLNSIHDADELLLVTRYQTGQIYAKDLMRIRDEGTANDLDIQRAEALATYLAEIHRDKHDQPNLWRRRLRDLVGHGEGIMGLTESFPQDQDYVRPEELRTIEELANQWRWRLMPSSHRLSQVHGDFHPFNVLFEKNLDLHLLDRSRGQWGEPADDISCMSINYVFFSLQRSGKLEGPFQRLHNRFWGSYLALQPDNELVEAIQPWFAWRALVLASPVWYPTISEDTRRKLLNFARQVMMIDRYDFRAVNQYLENPA
jgi:hypothetical protein